MSSLVYLLVWSPPPHIPYISSRNQCLLFAGHAHTIAACFAVVSILYHLLLVFLSTPYLELYLLSPSVQSTSVAGYHVNIWHTAEQCGYRLSLRLFVTNPPHTTTVLRPFFRDHPGELVPEENFWTLWCKGRLTEPTLTIWLGAIPSGLTSAHLHHLPIFLQAACPSCRPTNSVKALKATSTFGLGRIC